MKNFILKAITARVLVNLLIYAGCVGVGYWLVCFAHLELYSANPLEWPMSARIATAIFTVLFMYDTWVRK